MRFKMKAAAMAVLAAATLVACSDNETPSMPADVNQADVTFAQQMIPHHKQATEMAALAPERSQNAAVLALAERIEYAQEPEIELMTGWLEKWKQPVESNDDMDGMEGMDHGSMDDSDGSMAGMMSDEDMSSLENSTGEKFDRMFLTMMVAHHQGAVEMAQTEVANGEYEAAIDLATKIIKDQTSEITDMEQLLAS